MKAKLLLKVNVSDTDEDISYLKLYIVIPHINSVVLLDKEVKEDFENYLNSLEELANNASLWIAAIPGIKLIVDESVCEFIEDKEEEVKVFLKQMLIEL
jgi:hypothetical protein